MARRSRHVGKHWEQVAADYLRARGLVILERGYYCRLGELDVIALDSDTLVVVEVRYRSRRNYGSAIESVTWHKRQRILRATRHYLMRHPARAAMPLRFDIVAIDHGDDRPSLQWLRNAFHGA